VTLHSDQIEARTIWKIFSGNFTKWKRFNHRRKIWR